MSAAWDQREHVHKFWDLRAHWQERQHRTGLMEGRRPFRILEAAGVHAKDSVKATHLLALNQ